MKWVSVEGPTGVQLRHWRNATRKLECAVFSSTARPGDPSVAFDIKASREVRSDDLKGLRDYLATVAAAAHGIAFYRGR
jgi:hypothetical protein